MIPPEATPSSQSPHPSGLFAASPDGPIALLTLRATYILTSRRCSSLAVWAPGRRTEVSDLIFASLKV